MFCWIPIVISVVTLGDLKCNIRKQGEYRQVNTATLVGESLANRMGVRSFTDSFIINLISLHFVHLGLLKSKINTSERCFLLTDVL